MDTWPIVYIRGYAGPTSGINTQVDDPFYGFNSGSTHIRVDGDGAPAFYQFEGPLVRLIGDEGYKVYVRGSQEQILDDPDPQAALDPASLWIYRFYDQAATTFQAPPHQNLAERLLTLGRQKVTADGFNIEDAAVGLYDFIQKIRARTGAQKSVCGRPFDGRAHGTLHDSEEVPAGWPRRGPRHRCQVLHLRHPARRHPVRRRPGPMDRGDIRPGRIEHIRSEKMQATSTPPRISAMTATRVGIRRSWTTALLPSTTSSPDRHRSGRLRMGAAYGHGPQTDGLVHIANAYVRRAHRAYVYRSHSGSYGEVNSEEGYQNLRRFLFGRWAVEAALAGVQLPQEQAPPGRWTCASRSAACPWS